jgi:serine/threonine protein kinase
MRFVSPLPRGEENQIYPIYGNGPHTVRKVRHISLRFEDNSQFYARKETKYSASNPSPAQRLLQNEVDCLFHIFNLPPHPNLPALVDWYYTKGNNLLCLVTSPYADSGSLQDWLSSGIPHINYFALIGIFLGVSAGLAFAHSRHVIHQDIKPANIMLHRITDQTFTHRAILIDFDVSRVYTERSTLNEVHAGTKWYFAPEVICQQVSSRATDIWSLGLVFLECLFYMCWLHLKTDENKASKFRKLRENPTHGGLGSGNRTTGTMDLGSNTICPATSIPTSLARALAPLQDPICPVRETDWTQLFVGMLNVRRDQRMTISQITIFLKAILPSDLPSIVVGECPVSMQQDAEPIIVSPPGGESLPAVMTTSQLQIILALSQLSPEARNRWIMDQASHYIPGQSTNNPSAARPPDSRGPDVSMVDITNSADNPG